MKFLFYQNIYLLQLANGIYPLIGKTEPLEEALKAFQIKYQAAYTKMMHEKLGLEDTSEASTNLIINLDKVLQLTETDMTIFYRELSNFSKNTPIDEANTWLGIFEKAFYKPSEIKGKILDQWQDWISEYQKLLEQESRDDLGRKEAMDAVNPKYVLRNYMAQIAIDAADKGDYSTIEELYTLLKQPYATQPEFEKWYAKRPEWARHKVGCSMLSCSS